MVESSASWVRRGAVCLAFVELGSVQKSRLQAGVLFKSSDSPAALGKVN
jgi:hypothetical protein